MRTGNRRGVVNTNQPDNAIGMYVVMMLKSGQMKSLWLPEPPEGKFRFESASGEKNSHDFYFEARHGKWYAYSPQKDYFKNRLGETCSVVEVIDKCVFFLKESEYADVVYAESVYETSGVFHNYFVDSLAEIYIGRLNRNDIVYPNPLVSHTHAVLRRNRHIWHIEDLNSTNGVFVNGRKVAKAQLHLGDNIYIMGLRIIIGVGFISINDGNDRVSIASSSVYRSLPTAMRELPGTVPDKAETKELFNRLPRKRKALNANPIVIEAPPMSLNQCHLVKLQG